MCKQLLLKLVQRYLCINFGLQSYPCNCHRPPSNNTNSSASGEHPSQLLTSNPGVAPGAQSGSGALTPLNPEAPAFTTTPTSATLYVGSDKAILLQTALAEVSNPLQPSRALKIRIVLDSGSQRSYLTQRVKEALELPVIGKQHLSIAAFGTKRREPRQCEVVHLVVRTKMGRNHELDLFIVPHICDPLTVQPVSTCTKIYGHLSQIDLADTSNEELREVDMLIGSDFYWDFMTGEVIRGLSGPVAVNTTLGWVLSGPAKLSGPLKPTVNLVTTHTLCADCVTNEDLDTTLRSFWDLESLGIHEESNPVLNYFSKNVQMKDKRYEVSLPWGEHHDPLPDNLELCRKRLFGLLRRLKQNPEKMQEYDAIIRDQIVKGIVEKVDKLKEGSPELVHYLPHHAVIRQDRETTKLRVVYDASARSNGPSLNSCLHTGPKFNQRILEILLRFRSYPVALVADIEKAFLMISVCPRDRDVLRFLWVDNPFHDDSTPEVITLRFSRVVFGVSASPFLLNATIKHHVEKCLSTHPQLVATLLQSIYVDDVVAEADSEEEAYILYAQSKSHDSEFPLIAHTW